MSLDVIESVIRDYWMRFMTPKRVIAGLVGLLLASVAFPVSASTFTAQVFPDSTTSSSPVSLNNGGVNANGSFQGFGFAGSFVGVTGNAGGPFLGQVFTEATSNITDMMINGPGNSVTATVTLPFVSFLSGEYETAVFGNSGFSGGLQFGTNFGGFTAQANFAGSGDSTGNNDTLATSGAGWNLSVVPTFGVTLLAGPGGVAAIHDTSYVLNGSLQFTWTFPVGTPFTVAFDVIGNCGGGGGNSGLSAVCQFDAFDPWGFIPGYDSFDLPNGYTVDAPSIGLVNGIVPGAPVTSVPEPSALTVFGAGLLLLGAFAGLRRSVCRTATAE